MKEKMRQLTIKLSAEEMERVEFYAERELRSAENQVRLWMREVLEAQNEKVYQVRKTDGQGKGHDARQVQGQVEVK